MKICILQHAAFEGPGEIAVWAAQRSHSTNSYHLHKGEPLPAIHSFELLVVMGGEMNIYQDKKWPWLKSERDFIKAALDKRKRVVGICLGAQFLADALGAPVFRSAEVEMGWFPVTWTDEARAFFPGLASPATVLHWHGDAFGLPPGATRLAASKGCSDQGFLIRNKCLALQFHPEVDPFLVEQFVKSQDNWPAGPYTQTPEQILKDADLYCEKNKQLIHGLLDKFCEG